MMNVTFFGLGECYISMANATFPSGRDYFFEYETKPYQVKTMTQTQT